MSNSKRLAVLLNDGQQEQYDISGFATSIGRAAGNDYLLTEDPLVSKQHIFILYLKGQFIIQDVGSTNGTFLNGKKLACLQPYILKFGDEIVIGTTKLMFVDLMNKVCAERGVPTQNQEKRGRINKRNFEYSPISFWDESENNFEYGEQPLESIFVFEAVTDSVNSANQ